MKRGRLQCKDIPDAWDEPTYNLRQALADLGRSMQKTWDQTAYEEQHVCYGGQVMTIDAACDEYLFNQQVLKAKFWYAPWDLHSIVLSLDYFAGIFGDDTEPSGCPPSLSPTPTP